MTRLQGCGTALVTPFTGDGAVDLPALRALVEWQMQRQTAESLTLREEV